MAQLLVYWGGYQQGYDAFTHNPAEYASEVHIPTLHIHGEEDRNVTEPQAKRLFDALSGPKEYYCVQEAGHECYAIHSMAEWKKRVDTFLKTHCNAPE
jgi:dipeptidyl aminopeptidase/acylaminoacyl peptidase